jgi:hypothetical protein
MAGPVSSRVQHLRITVGLSVVVLAVATTVGAIAAGADAAVGVGAGVGLVIASYVASTLAIAWADSIEPRMVFGVGLGMYITKFTFFGLLLMKIVDSPWAGRIPMAIGIVTGVVAWTASQIWWAARHAHPYATASGGPAATPDSAATP